MTGRAGCRGGAGAEAAPEFVLSGLFDGFGFFVLWLWKGIVGVTGTYLKVSFAALADAQADLGRGVNVLTGKLADLERDAAPLVSTWEGSAQEAYRVHQAAWSKAAGELKSVLAQVQKAVGQSAQEYQDTENRNARRFA